MTLTTAICLKKPSLFIVPYPMCRFVDLIIRNQSTRLI